MFNFLHTYLPQPILFQFGFIKVYWYGVFIVLGIIAGLLVTLKLAKKVGIVADEVYNLGFYLIIFGLLGGRIYSIFLDLPFYLQNPFEIIAVWHGGLAIHGAIIGGAITLIIYCRRKHQSFWQWADLLAVALPLGQAIGRFGNYFNQEVFGKPTDLPWGIPIELANRPLEYLSQPYFQPTFLYESGLNLINFFVLLFLFNYFCHSEFISESQGTLKQVQGDKRNGLVFLVYLINYSLIRIGMEFLRVDTTPEVLGMRLPILVSVGIMIVSFILIIVKLKPKT